MNAPPHHVEPAPQLAFTIGHLLAQASAATGEKGHTDAQEITAITEAMMRLLAGIPLHSDGKLTIKSLAAEAGLLRNKLTHKHTGLKDLFNALVRTQNMLPAIADDLHRENNELRAKIAEITAERDALKTSNQRFARTVHVLEVENQQLRTQNSNYGNVLMLQRE